MNVISFDHPYRGHKTADGRIFTAQAVHSELVRENVTVCATDDDARRFAEQHAQTLEQQ